MLSDVAAAMQTTLWMRYQTRHAAPSPSTDVLSVWFPRSSRRPIDQVGADKNIGNVDKSGNTQLGPRAMTTLPNLRIDSARLWGELMETAAIGATQKGGICRLTLTDLDRQV